VDLGSARVKLWAPDRRGPVEVRMADGDGTVLVRRGAIIDVAAIASLLEDLLPVRAHRKSVVMATTPVGCGDAYRSDLREAFEILDPRRVLTIDGVKAAALGARADLTGSVLVVDIGAQLTQVALLAAGHVIRAHRTALGLSDLGSTVSPADLVQAISAAAVQMLDDDCGPRVVDALDRGILLTGGGALRPELIDKLAQQLGARVRPAPAPITAAVRGAGLALQATCRHPGSMNP
jgi:rod shape-determining protein MreB